MGMGELYVAVWGEMLTKKGESLPGLIKRLRGVFPKVCGWSILIALSASICIDGIASSRMEICFAGFAMFFLSFMEYIRLISAYSPQDNSALAKYVRCREKAASQLSEFLRTMDLRTESIPQVLICARFFYESKLRSSEKFKDRAFSVLVCGAAFFFFQQAFTFNSEGTDDLAPIYIVFGILFLALFLAFPVILEIVDAPRKTSLWNAESMIRALEMFEAHAFSLSESAGNDDFKYEGKHQQARQQEFGVKRHNSTM